jgi:hypothetical protein
MPFAQHTSGDVFDEAMTERPSIGFGKVSMDVYRVVLIKGQGKVAYDAAIHDPMGKRPSVAIDFKITPIDATRPVLSVNTMLDWTPEFKDVVRPSLQNLAAKIAAIRSVQADAPTFNPLREANGLYFRFEWVKRPGNKAGETWKTLCFRDVYPDEATCKEAAKKEGAVAEAAMDNALPFPSGPTAADLDIQRDALKAFLEPYWIKAKSDQKVFAEMLTKPPFNGLFTLDSDEVSRVITPF